DTAARCRHVDRVGLPRDACDRNVVDAPARGRRPDAPPSKRAEEGRVDGGVPARAADNEQNDRKGEAGADATHPRSIPSSLRWQSQSESQCRLAIAGVSIGSYRTSAVTELHGEL